MGGGVRADACVTPILSMAEAPHHPHNRARGTFVERGGFAHPAPAPRLSGTPGQIREPRVVDIAQAIRDWS